MNSCHTEIWIHIMPFEFICCEDIIWICISPTYEFILHGNMNSYSYFSNLVIHTTLKYAFILHGNMNSYSYFSNLWIHTTRKYEFILHRHMNSYTYSSDLWIHTPHKYEFTLQSMNSYETEILIHITCDEFI